ncbi:O-antigen polymerase [Natronincola ferrireducens]|uniref:Oligosaccharide repeat unit polymerase n=1 Tax=Natronincola ferrireducens TaxID=393762 RepID=A0A1G8X5R4_9FIRM|nr:O-antigen polymerase [Natronincola ferrireducens]SDJ85979.1 oligosaccharide repeat unit polymerase [Natronincola ferrireducens]
MIIKKSNERKKRVEKRNLFFLIFNIFILMLLLLFFIYTKDNNTYHSEWYKTVSILSLSLLIYYIVYFYNYRLFYDFRFWFIILTYLFMYSKIYLRFFGIEDPFYRPFLDKYALDVLYTTGMIVVCYTQALFTGFTWIGKRTKKSKLYKLKENISDLRAKKLIYLTGSILIAISLPFRLIVDYNTIATTYLTGSYSNRAGMTGLYNDIAILFIPGIVYLISSNYKKRRFATILAITTLLYFVLIMIMSGDRRYYITGILAVVLSYLKAYNINLSIIKLIILGTASNIMLNLLAVLRVIRSRGLLSPLEFLKQFSNDLINSKGIIEAMSEFGYSFYSVVQVVRFIPEYIPHQLGIGIFGAIPTLLPIGFIIRDFLNKVSISRTINVLDGHTLGSTIVGNLYADFSWFFVIAAIIFGKIMYEATAIKTIDNDNLAYARQYSMLYVLVNSVRASFLEIFRPSVTVYLIPIMILLLISKRGKFNGSE